MKVLKGLGYRIILLQRKLPMQGLNMQAQFIQFTLRGLPDFLLSHAGHIAFLRVFSVK